MEGCSRQKLADILMVKANHLLDLSLSLENKVSVVGKELCGEKCEATQSENAQKEISPTPGGFYADMHKTLALIENKLNKSISEVDRLN